MFVWLWMLGCAAFPGKTNDVFDIEIRYQGWTPSDAEYEAINQARLRWQSVLTSDIPDEYVQVEQEAVDALGTTPCFAMNQNVDDLLVHISIDDSHPTPFVSHICTRREDSPFYTSVGGIWLGNSALEGGSVFDQLEDAVVHEIGHVLGLRASGWNLDIDGDGIWERNLLPEMSECGTTQIHYVGPYANGVFQDMGGVGQIPMEDVGQPGTACEHWDNVTLNGEVMTGYSGSTPRALSAITVAAIEELGYDVNIGQAEYYELPAVP